jgi:hypothetical protein
MPVVVITQSPTLPIEYRDELARRVDVFGNPPEGLILHSRSDVADDQQLSVELWETTEFQERFVRERMMPAAQSLAEEIGLSEQGLPETLSMTYVTRPGIVTTLVDDTGNEVRKVTER